MKSTKPLVVTRHPLIWAVGIFFLLCALYMLGVAIFFTPSVDDKLALLLICLLEAALGIMFIAGQFVRTITVSTTGVTIVEKRRNVHAELPWENYRFLYALSGYRTYAFLLSPEALSRPAQYDACNACMRSKDVPFVHDGCLVLMSGMYGREIKERLPEHIRIMPEHECGTLWHRGKGL